MSNETQPDLMYHDLVLAKSNSAPGPRILGYFRRNYQRFLPQERGSAILDFGCGMGHMLYYLQSEGYTNVHGFDPSPGNIAYCRKHCNGNFVSGPDGLEYLLQNAGTFDVVICRDVVEHLTPTSLIDYARGLYGVLAQSGLAIVETENAAIPSGVYVYSKDITHQRMFSAESLAQFLEYGRFEGVRVFSNRTGSSLTAKAYGAFRTLGLLPWRLLLQIDRAGSGPQYLSQKIIAVGSKGRRS